LRFVAGALPVSIAARTTVSKSRGWSESPGLRLRFATPALPDRPVDLSAMILISCVLPLNETCAYGNYGDMTSEADRADLIRGRNAMMVVLDAKLKDMPEWQALRAMDRILASMEGRPAVNGSGESVTPRRRMRVKASYVDLAVEAIKRSGKPIPVSDIVSFITTERGIKDADSVRVNIQSALSRDNRVESIHWSGGRGWWITGREAPE
jgi:hypothetical protein